MTAIVPSDENWMADTPAWARVATGVPLTHRNTMTGGVSIAAARAAPGWVEDGHAFRQNNREIAPVGAVLCHIAGIADLHAVAQGRRSGTGGARHQVHALAT